MPRVYQSYGARAQWSTNALKSAFALRQPHPLPLKLAAMQYGIPHATLRRHSLDKVRQPGSKTLGRPCAIEPAEAEFAKHVLYMESI